MVWYTPTEALSLFYVSQLVPRKLLLNFLLETDAASGTSPDHAWGRYNISLAYTYEMRGNGPYGNFGFVLPPHLIIPNCEEGIDKK